MSRARTTATDLTRLLDDASAPLYVLDDQRRIVFCNVACAEWTQVPAAELVGRQCGFHPPEDDSRPTVVATALCPPPKVFSGEPQQAVVRCTLADGRAVYRRGQFWSLGEGQDDSSAVIAVLEPRDCPADAPCASPEVDLRLHDEVRRLRRQMAGRFRFEGFVGGSPAIVRARAQMELAAQCRANVLVTGPKGTGKDHAAKVIHYRAAEPGTLVPLACAVVETNLLRSTLRTLATRGAEPRGTLLLEDVDRLAGESQSDLVELVRAGTLPMRVIATLARPLEPLVADGQFSHELACALGTIVVELPPLAARLEDLPLLAQAFLEEINATGGKQVGGFASEALDRMAAHAWPGNVDELADVVRHAHERSAGGEVGLKDLPQRSHLAADAAAHPPRVEESIVLEEFLARVERELITRAMRRAKGNKSKAAKLLGLTRPRLYRRLVQLGMDEADGGEARP